MTKSLWKDLFREIRKDKSRFLSIFFIVALGVAFLAGVRAAEPDMLYSVDKYYDSQEFMDLRVISTLGLTDDDVLQISAVKGVEYAVGARTLEVFCHFLDYTLEDAKEETKSIKVYEYVSGINEPYITEGELPQNADECLIDYRIAQDFGISIGDTITLIASSEEELLESLKYETYTVTGFGMSPWYLTYDRGTGSIGNGTIDYFVMIPGSAFVTDVYSEIYVQVDGAAELVSGSDEYEDLIDLVASRIEAIEESLGERRLEEIKLQTKQEALESDEYLEAYEEAYEEALSQIKEEAYEEAYETAYSQAYEIALAQIKQEAKEAAWAQLLDEAYEPALEVVKTEAYEQGLEEINSQAKSLIDQAVAAYCEANNERVRELLEQIEKMESSADALNELLGLIDELEMPELDTELIDTDTVYVLVLRQIHEIVAGQEISSIDQEALSDEVYEQLSPQIEELYAAYFEQQFESLYKTIFDLQYEDAIAEEYWEQFEEEFEKTFEEEYLETFNEEFEKTFEEEYLETFNEEFESTFESEYLELFNETFEETFLEEFEEKLDEELESISLPTWYCMGRGDSVASYIEYQQDAEAIGKIGQVFPLLFFLVAALVALTTMTRMVEDDRSQIGTLKSLGYANMAIAAKYLLYTLLAAVFGSIFGNIFGEIVFPYVIMNAYAMLFVDIPAYYVPFQWDIAIIAGLAAVGCIFLATLAACIKTTADKPASLMRPPAPKAGKRIFMEHITIIWRHLSFTAKASMRNLFRYKKRLFMTVFGISGCMSLLLVGLGLRDSILTIAKYQYRQIFTYDVSVSLSADADEDEMDELLDQLDAYTGITEYETLHTETVDAVYGSNTKSLNLYVFLDTEEAGDYISLRDRSSGEEYEFPETGIALSEKAANKLEVSTGDLITLRNGDNEEVSVEVTCIFENYVNHYILMSGEVYEELFGEPPTPNLVYLNNETRDEDYEDDLAQFLRENASVSGVVLVSYLDQNLDDMLSSLNVVTWVLIISAGLLAFVVLYNLNNINISERRRELATIKVLGFYHGEVAAYVYRDNIWLTAFGCILGCFLGTLLHAYIVETVEVEIMMFGRSISTSSYILSILLTAFFSVFVNFIMYFQLKKIDMVESLKSVE